MVHSTLQLFALFLFYIMTSNSDAFATENNKNEIPQLSPPDPEATLPSIRFGESISFEHFGPIILNTDGSTRRIANWDTLSDHEKAKTWERISKRNEQRRQVLLEQQEEILQDKNQSGEGKAEKL
jgi:hypothetical protein